MDLGVKEKPYDSPAPVSPSDSKEPKVNYPSFDVREEKADTLRDEYDCDVDQTGTATIKFRISGDAKDRYSNRVTLEVISIDDVVIEGEADEDTEESKTLGYKRPRANPSKESPDISASTLE